MARRGAGAALWLVLALGAGPADPQLLINVRNQGGDVMLETITANVSDNTVMLEFLRSDGVYITQVIDFTNEVQILKVIAPGEEELGQSDLHVMCFLTHADKSEFIAADAMVKLRQKNPGTIRMAEEDRGSVTLTMTLWVGGVVRSLSPYAAQLCADAGKHVYSSHADVAKWIERPNQGMETSWLLNSVTPFPQATNSVNEINSNESSIPSCVSEHNLKNRCICHFGACISWYPCGLKYCKGKPQPNIPAQNLSYRCGIKTCRKCQRLEYYVQRKQHCLWDE